MSRSSRLLSNDAELRLSMMQSTTSRRSLRLLERCQLAVGARFAGARSRARSTTSLREPSSSTTSSTNSSSSSSSSSNGTSSASPKSISLPSMPKRAARCLFSLSSDAAVEAPAHVLRVELPELDGDRLEERGEADRLVDAHRHVADAVLERGEERMRPHVPPDLLRVVDAVRLHQQSARTRRTRSQARK